MGSGTFLSNCGQEACSVWCEVDDQKGDWMKRVWMEFVLIG